MDRRELIKQIALLAGGAFIGAEFLLSGCKSGASLEAGFSPANIALLDEVGETILPATQTPGAKAAQVGEFMKVMVTDCYTAKEQATFTKGIVDLDNACQQKFGKGFMNCTAAQRKELLISLEKEAKAFNEQLSKSNEGKPEAAKEPLHYYTMMKQLTLFGFFTSKTGATETLRHVAVPGKYEGAYAYKIGDKAWAE